MNLSFSLPIVYLSNNDFTPNGDLKPQTSHNLPVFVMIQSNSCGHCTQAKPAFQTLAIALANKGRIKCMTIQADDPRQSVRALMARINNIYPNLEGYPSYILFRPDGKRITYKGKRDVNSMLTFVNTYS